MDDDPVLAAALEANAGCRLPPHDVAPNQGKLLVLLARLARARSALEIGTLAGRAICSNGAVGEPRYASGGPLLDA